VVTSSDLGYVFTSFFHNYQFQKLHVIILRYFKFCIIYPQEERGFLFSHPEGLRKVLNYIKERYNNMPVYIKENGQKLFPFLFFAKAESFFLLTRNSENFLVRSYLTKDFFIFLFFNSTTH